jgi:hypothetical protein
LMPGFVPAGGHQVGIAQGGDGGEAEEGDERRHARDLDCQAGASRRRPAGRIGLHRSGYGHEGFYDRYHATEIQELEYSRNVHTLSISGSQPGSMVLNSIETRRDCMGYYRCYFLICVFLSSLALRTTQAEPTLYVESRIAPPGASGRAGGDRAKYSFNVYANEDVRGIRDGGLILFTFRSLTPNTPEIPGSLGTTIELTSFDGPGILVDAPFTIPDTAPEGAVYLIDTRFVRGPFDKNGETVALTIHNGALLVRKAPYLPGDLDDDGSVRVQDAILSLRIALGLEARVGETVIDPLSPYVKAAGDLNRDGQLTIADAILTLQAAVS